MWKIALIPMMILVLVGCATEYPTGIDMQITNSGSGDVDVVVESTEQEVTVSGGSNEGGNDNSSCCDQEKEEEVCYSEPSGTPIDCETGEPI